MYRVLILAAIFFLSFVMISCGDDTGNTGNTGDTGDTGNSGDTGDTGDSGNTGDTGVNDLTPSSVQGIWKEMFVEITDTCEGQNESSTPSDASFIKIVLTAGDLLEVYHLYECEDQSYDSCLAEDIWGSGSVFEDSSISVFFDKETDDLGDLEWESDDRDCQLISQEELIINFEDGDDAELVMTASYKTTGKDCDSEVVNDYLNGDYGSLNYKDCSYKEIVQIKKVGDVEEE